MKPNYNPLSKSNLPDSRQGSTLLVVVALLGMLAFLGFVFYTFAKQERANAISSSDAAKILKAPSIEPDSLFDFALMQVILGPSDDYPQSILWGGRHSLLANMFGRDGIAWNGEGVNLIQSSGQPAVDMNFNLNSGDTVDNQQLLNYVDSPAANAGNWNSSKGLWGFNKYFTGIDNLNPNLHIPEPDPNYNSPNIDSVFLSYEGFAIDNNTPPNIKKVIIPSYLRPQYLRSGGNVVIEDINRNGILDTGEDANGNGILDDWYQLPAFANQIMRPHPSHVCVNGQGAPLQRSGVNIPRFVTSLEYQSLGLRRPFTSLAAGGPGSFAPPEFSQQSTPGSIGVWTPTIGGASVGELDIDLDIDTDGDGTPDAILMDLGYPPFRRGDGKLVVPLFAISVRDLNGLLNVNATGNINGNINLGAISAQNPFGSRKTGANPSPSDNLSQSNLGLSTYEINIQRAFSADPTNNNDPRLLNSEAARQVVYFLRLFDSSVSTAPGRSVAELANVEWFNFNVGRPLFHLGLAVSASPLQNAIVDILVGRSGELTRETASGAGIVSFDSLSTPQWLPRFPPLGVQANDVVPSSFRKFLATGSQFDLPQSGSSLAWNKSIQGAPINWPPTTSYFNPDDNNNANEGEGLIDGVAVSRTRWVHPLDFRGTGIQFQRYAFGPDLQPGVAGVDDDNNGVTDDFSEEGYSLSDDILTPLCGKTPELYQLNMTPLYWPQYSGYHSYYGASNGGVRWGETSTTQTYSTSLMRGIQNYSLLDDPTEAVIDPELMSPSYLSFLSSLTSMSPAPAHPVTPTMVSAVTNSIANDGIFDANEILFLQGSSSDASSTEASSRLARLMPANLVASKDAATIRKRLTTVSSDRREFGLGKAILGNLRSWESTPSFPPYSTSGPPSPFRAELYYYLQQAANLGPSQKLNVNRWLFLDGQSGNQYGFAPLPEQTSTTDTNATTVRQNMARDIYTLLYMFCYVHNDGGSPPAFDVDYRTVTVGHTPTPAEAKEMAQFAVNLVDALDSDNIITAFYYKPDLSDTANGWDSNTYYGPDGIQGTSDDTVVFGVERQMLAFSEASAFVVQYAKNDDLKTIFFDDMSPMTGRAYLFFELQNVSPMNVTLASPGVTAANAATMADWRVRLTNPDESQEYNVLYFLPGLDTTNNLLQSVTDAYGATTLALPPGKCFSVGSQDGTDTIGGKCRTSDYRADMGADGNYELIVPVAAADGSSEPTPPNASTPAAQFKPKCNLDLCWDYGDGQVSPSRFTFKNNAGIPGGFVSQVAGLPSIRMHLERRVAAGGTGGVVVWVPVDKTSNTTPGAAAPDVVVGSVAPSAAVTGFSSYPRVTPLLRGSAVPVEGLKNTFNVTSTTTLNNNLSIAWQHHNDRDFGSLAELLQLPLYGPDQLTAAIAQTIVGGGGITVTSITPNISVGVSNGEFHQSNVTGSSAYYPTIAAARFLRPDNPDYTANNAAGAINSGNRWYRLFDFLEVPNRSHTHQAIVGFPPSGSFTFGSAGTPNYGLPVTFTTTPGIPGATTYSASSSVLSGPFNLPQYFGWPRAHGLLNLNMIRDPQVLLALLDDDKIISDPRYNTGAGAASAFLDSADSTDSRRWWVEFVKARDSSFVSGSAFQLDPVTNLFVPGAAGGRPFRGIDSIGPLTGNVTNGDSPIEHTIFRSLPADAGTNSNESRRLFEVGNNSTDHFGAISTESSSMPIHPTARYRLFSKLLNNSTTRSNSFGVFVAAQYFEAVEVPTDTAGVTAVRVGGRLTDTPTHRGFFVVDRTAAIDQLKALAANVSAGSISVVNPATFPVSASSYSFQPNTDRSGVRRNMNGIRWKDLVLFRQTLN